MKPEQLQTLERLVGTWKGKRMRYESGDIKSDVEVELEVRRIVDGWGLESTMVSEIPGVGEYRERDLWGYDHAEKSIHMFSVKNMGQSHDHSGAWKDEKTLRLMYTGVANGKDSVVEEIMMTFNNGHMELLNSARVNGKLRVLFEGTLTRQV